MLRVLVGKETNRLLLLCPFCLKPALISQYQALKLKSATAKTFCIVLLQKYNDVVFVYSSYSYFNNAVELR